MAGRVAFVLACSWRALALQEELETGIPPEAWDAAACSANGGSDEDCQLHLLQLRAQSVTAEPGVNDGAGAQTEGPAVHDLSSESAVQNVSAQSNGACSAQDRAKMSAMGGGSRKGTFPWAVAHCAEKGLKWFRFHRDVMHRCISSALGISMQCAGCYSYIGQFGYDRCKAQCVFSKWCGNGCLSCTKLSYPAVDACAGWTAPFPSVC